MTTSSASKNTTTSPCGDSSKNHIIDKSLFCRHCRNPIGFSSHTYPDPDFSNALLICLSCGHENADLSGFYLVSKDGRSIASPEFSTLDEANQFADIFGLSELTGYGFCAYTNFYNGHRDEQARHEHLDQLSWGRQTLMRLVELLPACHGTEDLKCLAVSLRLNWYALPLFRDLSSTAEIE